MNVNSFWITPNNVSFCRPNLSSVFDLGLWHRNCFLQAEWWSLSSLSVDCVRGMWRWKGPRRDCWASTQPGDTQLGCIPGLLTVKGPRGVIPQPPAENLGTGAQACHASNIFSWKKTSHALWGKNSVFPNILLNLISPPSSIFISRQENFQIIALLLSHLW